MWQAGQSSDLWSCLGWERLCLTRKVRRHQRILTLCNDGSYNGDQHTGEKEEQRSIHTLTQRAFHPATMAFGLTCHRLLMTVNVHCFVSFCLCVARTLWSHYDQKLILLNRGRSAFFLSFNIHSLYSGDRGHNSVLSTSSALSFYVDMITIHYWATRGSHAVAVAYYSTLLTSSDTWANQIDWLGLWDNYFSHTLNLTWVCQQSLIGIKLAYINCVCTTVLQAPALYQFL